MGEAKRRKAAGAPPIEGWQDMERGEALPALEVQTRIATAVHRVIVTTYGDGVMGAMGMCHLYAWLGARVAGEVTGHRDYVVQAGSLDWAPDSADPDFHLAMDAQDGGLARGELHAWIVRKLDGGRAELVDFTTRHLPARTALMAQAPERYVLPGSLETSTKAPTDVHWAQPEGACPDFVWSVWRPGAPPDWGTIPDWLHYHADRATTQALWRQGCPLQGPAGDAYARRLLNAALLIARHPEVDVTVMGPAGRVG
jgi:hypothetical protein